MNRSEAENNTTGVLSILRLLRPEQWLKNLFIFLPLFFAGAPAGVWHDFADLALTFGAFSLAASGVYCLNDIIDAEADRLHPRKRLRPVASGAVSKASAGGLCAVCWGLAALLCMLLPAGERCMGVGAITAGYVVLNVAYCLKLKQIAIVDVFIIATGFVLRVFAGGVAANIELSHWIVLMTFLLALFLAFAKRRDDVVIYEETGAAPRKNIVGYNIVFMNQVIAIVATITMVCYIMYTLSPELMERLGSQYVYLTSIFVLAGIIRYLQITTVDVRSGSPTKVLMRDRFIQVCIIGWILSFYTLLYL